MQMKVQEPITITWQCEGRDECARIYSDMDQAKAFLRFLVNCTPFLFIRIVPDLPELLRHRDRLIAKREQDVRLRDEMEAAYILSREARKKAAPEGAVEDQ